MTKQGLGILAVAMALLAPLTSSETASAQEWLKDRRYAEGAGYKAGDLELHPGLAGEIGYDSNWFLRTDKTGPQIVNGAPAEPVTDGALLRITPSLSLSTLGPQRREGPAGEPPKITFRGGLSATYREFFGTQELRDQRNVSGNANFNLGILPQRPVNGSLFADYTRTISPSVLGNPDLSFNRDDITGGADLGLQPNSGTLDWRFGYQIHTTLFEQSAGAPYSSLSHQLSERGRWKFRPRSAILHDTTYSFASYMQADRATTTLHDSTPLRTRLGLSSLVTPRFAFLGLAGWGASFFRSRTANTATDPMVQQFDSVIGQVQFTFFPTSNPSAEPGAPDASLTLSSIAIGFTRDFQTSYLSDFYTSDRGYARVSYFFAGRALISLDGGVGAVEYPTVYPNPPGGAPPHAPFTDVRADGTLFGEYRFSDSVGVNATFNYAQNFSNTQLQQPGNAPNGQPFVYDMSWKRFQAFLGVRWFM
jgi:hypothetical protein